MLAMGEVQAESIDPNVMQEPKRIRSRTGRPDCCEDFGGAVSHVKALLLWI